MTTATYDVQGVVANETDYADGHTSSQILEPNFYDCAVTRPPGGVLASVIDYAHFAETLFADDGQNTNPMIDSASISAMETGHVDTDELPNGQEKYGYGLEAVNKHKGVHIVTHTGSDDGYHSVFLVPDQKLAVIIFSTTRARGARRTWRRTRSTSF